MSSEKPAFYELVKILAEIIPIEYIEDACFECYGFYKSIKYYLDEPAEVIRILLSRLSLTEQKTYWKKIYVFLLQQDKDEANFGDPQLFAGWLIFKMPVPLQMSAYQYFYTLTSEKEVRWDPTFENLWQS